MSKPTKLLLYVIGVCLVGFLTYRVMFFALQLMLMILLGLLVIGMYHLFKKS